MPLAPLTWELAGELLSLIPWFFINHVSSKDFHDYLLEHAFPITKTIKYVSKSLHSQVPKQRKYFWELFRYVFMGTSEAQHKFFDRISLIQTIFRPVSLNSESKRLECIYIHNIMIWMPMYIYERLLSSLFGCLNIIYYYTFRISCSSLRTPPPLPLSRAYFLVMQIGVCATKRKVRLRHFRITFFNVEQNFFPRKFVTIYYAYTYTCYYTYQFIMFYYYYACICRTYIVYRVPCIEYSRIPLFSHPLLTILHVSSHTRELWA